MYFCYLLHLPHCWCTSCCRILDSWTRRMGRIGCPETSVRNYHYSLRNDPDERSSLVSSSFTTRILYYFYYLPHLPHCWCGHPSSIERRGRISKFLILRIFSLSCQFFLSLSLSLSLWSPTTKRYLFPFRVSWRDLTQLNSVLKEQGQRTGLVAHGTSVLLPSQRAQETWVSEMCWRSDCKTP